MTETNISQKAWDYALISVKGDILPVANMHLLAANIQVILDTEAAKASLGTTPPLTFVQLKEIWTQLNDIHTEFIGEITPEQLEAAWANGQANPCGCSICQLLEAVTIAEIGEAATKVKGGNAAKEAVGE